MNEETLRGPVKSPREGGREEEGVGGPAHPPLAAPRLLLGLLRGQATGPGTPGTRSGAQCLGRKVWDSGDEGGKGRGRWVIQSFSSQAGVSAPALTGVPQAGSRSVNFVYLKSWLWSLPEVTLVPACTEHRPVDPSAST